MYKHEPEHYNCPFCRMAAGDPSMQDEVVKVTERAIVCIGLHHHENSGPTFLVVPREHVENIYDIEDDLLAELHLLAKRVAIVMRKLWGTQGVSLWQNNEPAGSQDVWHFHIHVKARKQNDQVYCSEYVKTPVDQKLIWAAEFRECFSSIDGET